MMQKVIASAVAVLFAGSVFAQAPAEAKPEKPKTAQQMRMKNCNAEAREKALKGAERKAFMKSCLKGEKQ